VPSSLLKQIHALTRHQYVPWSKKLQKKLRSTPPPPPHLQILKQKYVDPHSIVVNYHHKTIWLCACRV